MLEKILPKPRTSVEEKGRKLCSRLPAFSSGVWIVIAVVILVGGRFLWVKANRPAHRQEIADAFGSTVQYFGEAQLNHDGSRLTYVSTSDNGYGVFLYDQATGHKQLIGQQSHQGPLGNFCDLTSGLGLPMTVRSFIPLAITCLSARLIPRFRSPKPFTSMGLPSYPMMAGTPALTSLVWVNPREFAYLFDGVIGYAKMEPDGQWTTDHLPCEELPNAGGASCLTAVSADSISWLMNGVICRVRLDGRRNRRQQLFYSHARRGQHPAKV